MLDLRSIFVIDRYVPTLTLACLSAQVLCRSGSMSSADRVPLQGTPVTQRIAAHHNNRLGAVYSALYAFWSARATAQTQAGQAILRRDAYSVILFDNNIDIPLENNFQSSSDDLLTAVLAHHARGGTNFNLALENIQTVMERRWSTDRFVGLQYS
jgi:hypothetical protein